MKDKTKIMEAYKSVINEWTPKPHSQNENFVTVITDYKKQLDSSWHKRIEEVVKEFEKLGLNNPTIKANEEQTAVHIFHSDPVQFYNSVGPLHVGLYTNPSKMFINNDNIHGEFYGRYLWDFKEIKPAPTDAKDKVQALELVKKLFPNSELVGSTIKLKK